MRLSDTIPFVNTLVNTIKQIYPHLTIEDANLNQEGQYNDVLMVRLINSGDTSREEWVFRFPKFAEGIGALQRESAILNAIQAQITLAIPQPQYQHLETATVGEAFIGYTLLAGQPLWLKKFQAIHNPTAQMLMAHQLAEFLRQLHTIPIAQLQSIDLPIADQPDEWLDLYQRIQQTLFPHMRADARIEVSEHFENYFATSNAFHYEPVLRHGDFGTGNILHDPTTLTISGVIDFGATTLGDPAIDFAGLFTFGEPFCRHCYTVYPELEAMLPRVRFYRGTFALQEALYGAEVGDTEAFQSGMQNYV